MPDDRKVRAPKWQQTVRTVDWLTTQIKPGTKVQIYVFNEAAHSVVDGTDGQLDRRPGRHRAQSRRSPALRKVVPQKGQQPDQCIRGHQDARSPARQRLPDHRRAADSGRKAAIAQSEDVEPKRAGQFLGQGGAVSAAATTRQRACCFRWMAIPTPPAISGTSHVATRRLTADAVAGLAMMTRKRRSNRDLQPVLPGRHVLRVRRRHHAAAHHQGGRAAHHRAGAGGPARA